MDEKSNKTDSLIDEKKLNKNLDSNINKSDLINKEEINTNKIVEKNNISDDKNDLNETTSEINTSENDLKIDEPDHNDNHDKNIDNSDDNINSEKTSEKLFSEKFKSDKATKHDKSDKIKSNIELTEINLSKSPNRINSKEIKYNIINIY